ncbi:MAG TPA: KilA-N domain-containing protein [Desulfitobacteriaceae bacterium]|nr:KilA-N domain-containing protein [Desulfitobacteriaceae bacterium]
MEDSKNSDNLVMYVIAKEQYLTALLNEGTISQDEFEKMDRFLYERFHIKGTNTDDFNAVRAAVASPVPAVPKPKKKQAQKVSVPVEDTTPEITQPKSVAFVSLTEAVHSCTEDLPAHVIQSWMRSPNTLKFLGLWENARNPDFSHEGYAALMERQKGGSFAVTPKQWIDRTNAIGMTSKPGKTGGTHAHPLIACEFMMWLSPTYKLALLEMRSDI